MNAPLRHKLDTREIDLSSMSDAELLAKLQEITEELSELLEVLRGAPCNATGAQAPPPHTRTQQKTKGSTAEGC